MSVLLCFLTIVSYHQTTFEYDSSPKAFVWREELFSVTMIPTSGIATSFAQAGVGSHDSAIPP
jgi:hypothetical protein